MSDDVNYTLQWILRCENLHKMKMSEQKRNTKDGSALYTHTQTRVHSMFDDTYVDVCSFDTPGRSEATERTHMYNVHTTHTHIYIYHTYIYTGPM